MRILFKIFELIGIMDIPTIFITFFIFIWFIPFIIITGTNKEKNNRKYILMSFIPLCVLIVFYLFNYTKGNSSFGILRYMPQIIIACIYVLAGVLPSMKNNRKPAFVILSVSSVLFTFGSLLYNLGVEGTIHLNNSSHLGYEASISKALDDLEGYYQLNEYKELDYNSLREKYISRARTAEQNDDKLEFAKIISELCYEFHDGHLYYMINDSELDNQLTDELAGNDYGFSMIELDDGSVVVILLDDNSEAKEKGIYNGAVITKWNGVEIKKALASASCISPTWPYEDFPCIENEDTVRAIYLAGKGEDTINVSFVTENGNETTISLNSKGSYAGKLLTATRVFTKRFQEEFAYTEILDDKIGYIVIPRESYDTYGDTLAYLTDDYPKIKDLFINKIDELRSQGMEKLIVDLRGNGGGYDAVYEQFVSLFTTEEMVRYGGFCSGNNSFKKSNNLVFTIEADGRYADIPVVALVNAGCASSGDLLAYNMSLCPNVTMMGITTSWGSAQAAGGVCFLSEGTAEIHYPIYPSINEDGTICIDAGKDRKSSLILDVKIPLTEETVNEIMYSDNDYELEYAVSYIREEIQ